MPQDDYFKLDALGSSDLSMILRSVAHYAAAKASERIETKALKLGTVVHKAVLEPLAFNPVVTPDVDRRTKEGKARYEQFLAESIGKDVLSADELSIVYGIKSACHDHPEVSELLSGGVAESVGISYYQKTKVRCRPDWRIDSQRILLDLKTTEDASPEAFAKTIASYKYHLQAALYCHIARDLWGESPRWYWIVAEKAPPYTVAVYQPDSAMLASGEALLARAVAQWESALERGAFDEGRLRKCELISLPIWADVF
jgi:exodeoxyribonuclease VIII